jgi:hypothetical protein
MEAGNTALQNVKNWAADLVDFPAPDWWPDSFMMNGRIMWRPAIQILDRPFEIVGQVFDRYFYYQMRILLLQAVTRVSCKLLKAKKAHHDCKVAEKYINQTATEYNTLSPVVGLVPFVGRGWQFFNETLGVWMTLEGSIANLVVQPVIGELLMGGVLAPYEPFIQLFQKTPAQTVESQGYPVWVTGKPEIDQTGLLTNVLLPFSLLEIDQETNNLKQPTKFPGVGESKWVAVSNGPVVSMVEGEGQLKGKFSVDWDTTAFWCLVSDAVGGAVWSNIMVAGDPEIDDQGRVYVFLDVPSQPDDDPLVPDKGLPPRNNETPPKSPLEKGNASPQYNVVFQGVVFMSHTDSSTGQKSICGVKCHGGVTVAPLFYLG